MACAVCPHQSVGSESSRGAVASKYSRKSAGVARVQQRVCCLLKKVRPHPCFIHAPTTTSATHNDPAAAGTASHPPTRAEQHVIFHNDHVAVPPPKHAVQAPPGAHSSGGSRALSTERQQE